MRLKVGDVVFISTGMIVTTNIPSKFIYSNRRLSSDLTESQIVVGKMYKIDNNLIEEKRRIAKGIIESFKYEGFNISEKNVWDFIDNNIGSIKSDEFIFEPDYFVVIKTALEGGGTGHGQFDIYPDGHHVYLKRLNNGEYDKNGDEISFYQSGCFNNIVKDINVVKTMEMSFC